ncbi:MAG: M28 family peptidase [Vicinamibacterales bacterium]
MTPRHARHGRLAAAWLAIGLLCLGGDRQPLAARANVLQAPARQARAAVRIDEERLIQDVRTLASPDLEGRLTGSAGSRRARAIIVERFERLQLRPFNGSYEQAFSFTQTRGGRKQEFPDASNVMGYITGRRDPQSYIVVSAHFDHLGVREGKTYPGADDNASGVAALLAIAGWFVEHQPGKSLLFVAFDAEEQGLQGSKHFVAHPPVPLDRIAAVVNMDMIGRGDANRLFVAGTHHHPSLKPVVSAAASGRALEVAFGHDTPSAQASGADDWTNSSDHGPFHAAGIPFLYFGVEDHPDYHKPTDTADKIPRRFYREATELVLETVRRMAEIEDRGIAGSGDRDSELGTRDCGLGT